MMRFKMTQVKLHQRREPSSRTRLNATLIALSLLSIMTLANNLIRPASCSGVFEINFSSLVDAFGRDLRDDCCSWQNQSQQFNLMPQHRASNGKQHQVAVSAADQADSCDPKKCQLIVRICVKNYESQDIEASQCTFGELTAQVSPSKSRLEQLQATSMLASQQTSDFRQQQAKSLSTQQLPQTLTSNRFNVHYQKLHHHHAISPHQSGQQLNSNHLNQQAAYSINSNPIISKQPQISLAASQARALRQISFKQSISFPFNFTWPDSYSLVVDAWYESPSGVQQVAMPNHHHFAGQQQQQAPQQVSHHHRAQMPPMTLFDLYRKQLIIHHSIRGWLPVKEEWTNEVHKTEVATLAYSYRVTCEQNYFGDHCNFVCRPRDDIYGHYTCSQQGSVQCLPGWQGIERYCVEPICLAGCHRDQGNCSRPNECNCRYGWQGATCDQCITHPGCVHGYCNKPYECLCQKGWTGALCNEEENICSNKQPCQNGATCLNSIDAEGKSSYICNCEPGFSGKNCERRTQANSGSESTISKQQAIQSNQNSNSINQQQATGNLNNNNVTSAAAASQQQQANSRMRSRTLNQQQSAGSQLTDVPGPFFPQPITLSSQQQSLDRWLPEAYMVIIVSLVVLVLLLLLRLVLERPNLRQYGWWADCDPAHSLSGASGRGHAGSIGVGQVEDVATLQNHQNIYKSRGSIQSSTEKTGYDSLYGSSLAESLASSSSIGDRTLPRPPHHQSQQMSHPHQHLNQNNNNNASHYQSRHLLHHHSFHNLHSIAAASRNAAANQNSASSSTNLTAACPPPPYQKATSTNYAPTTYGTHSLYGIPAQPARLPGALSPSAGRRALSQARLYSTNNNTSNNNPANLPANQHQQLQLNSAVSSSALQANVSQAAAAGQAIYQSPYYVIAYIQPN